MGPGLTVEHDAFVHAMMVETGWDTDFGQIIEHIDRIGPVFKALKIIVEAVADIVMPFAYDDLLASQREDNGACQARRSGSDNRELRPVPHIVSLGDWPLSENFTEGPGSLHAAAANGYDLRSPRGVSREGGGWRQRGQNRGVTAA
tara:strand:+ start:262 stop:699 length:438 start_codon:yes stop_codon:yes gene_type:complete